MNGSRFFSLFRPGVSLAVAVGSLSGALFYELKYKIDFNSSYDVLPAACGAFLLCAGCSALNQVQERRRDAAMRRTKARPLACGALSPLAGLALAAAALACGLLLFMKAAGLPLLGVGLVVLLAYNGLYTPLKPITPLCLLAGGLAGAMPPLTGWLAAGGDVSDPFILILTGVFYLWQVPHFWLLAEKHRLDYRRAGFRLTAEFLPPGSRKRVMALWVAAYFLALACLLWQSGNVPPLAVAALVPAALGSGLAVLRAKSRPAALAIDLSLPLALGAALLISL